MSPWLKAAAPALLICGAFAKACVLLDANVAMLTISTIVCLALACYVYVTARNKQPTSALVVALSLVAIETLIYGMSVILQFAVIPPGAAYLVYYKIKMVYIGAWAVLRIAVTITMSPQSDQIYWQLAQVMLLFGLAIARFKKDKLTQPRRIFAIGFCVVVAAVLYGGVVLLPQRISIFLIATPITFLLASAISHLDNEEQNVADNDMMTWIDYFVVFAILCICFVYPFDAAASASDAFDCSAFANTEQCGLTTVPGEFQIQISTQCCCKAGYIQMPGRQSCVRAECQSNLLANADRDCCKIKRSLQTDKFLYGPHQCMQQRARCYGAKHF